MRSSRGSTWANWTVAIFARASLSGSSSASFGVVGQPLERGDLAVRDGAQQVDDRGPVGEVLEGDRILLGTLLAHRAAEGSGDEVSVMAAPYR